MAKAHQPPTATKDQTYYVTHHALDRIRERSEPAAHLTDYALCRVIDDAVVQATQDEGNLYDVRDQDAPAELVHVQAEHMDGLTLKGPMFALLKKNNAVGDSPYKKAVITVLTERMAQKYYGKYIKPNGFSNTMASQLRNLDIVPTKAEPKPQPKKEAEPFYLILEGENLVQRGTKQEVSDWLLESPAADVEVLRCFPVQVKVTVELE